MSNHYHLLIETAVPNLSLGMRHLNGIYTQSFNRKHRKSGHVFQGRFKSFVVDKQSYLMALSSYIVLNPVRAKLVKRPEEWRWSSYRAAIGLEQTPKWLDTSFIIGQFEGFDEEARCRYKLFVSEQLNEKSPFSDVVGQIFLGGKDFVDRMRVKVAEKFNHTEIPREQRHVCRMEMKGLFNDTKTNKERNEAIIEAHIKHGHKQADIAKHLGLHYTTISKILSNRGNSRFKT
jgi:hypothetical protein